MALQATLQHCASQRGLRDVRTDVQPRPHGVLRKRQHQFWDRRFHSDAADEICLIFLCIFCRHLGSRPMIQLLPRTRVQNLIASRLRGGKFKIPSTERDSGTGHARIEAIISAIEAALTSAESERDELNNRIEEVLARASVTVGNATDEYLDREFYRSHHQDLFDSEMARGEERTRELSAMIVHFRFVRAAMLSRFSCVSEINR